MKLLYFCNLFIISCNAFCIQPTNSLLLYSSKQICLHIKNNNFVLYKKPLSLLSPSLLNMNLKKNKNKVNDNNNFVLYKKPLSLLSPSLLNMNLKKNKNKVNDNDNDNDNEIKTYEYLYPLLAFNIIYNLILLAFNIIHNLILL